MNAWIRETDAAAKVNAGYMTLVNVGTEEVALLNIASEAFESIEIHEMSMDNGLMMMNEVTSLIIPANGKVQLAPGGKHLMLKGPKHHLTVGQQVDITLTFKSGIKQRVLIKVAAN
ncbi:MAG: copper chaperone PCu(A)C [Pseudomonadales bacterium]